MITINIWVAEILVYCTHLKSLFNSELSLGSFGGDLNLNLSGGFNRNVISSVRHPTVSLVYLHYVANSDTHFLSDFKEYYRSDVFVRFR